jgi:hypothetical protein
VAVSRGPRIRSAPGAAVIEVICLACGFAQPAASRDYPMRLARALSSQSCGPAYEVWPLRERSSQAVPSTRTNARNLRASRARVRRAGRGIGAMLDAPPTCARSLGTGRIAPPAGQHDHSAIHRTWALDLEGGTLAQGVRIPAPTRISADRTPHPRHGIEFLFGGNQCGRVAAVIAKSELAISRCIDYRGYGTAARCRDSPGSLSMARATASTMT